MFNLMEIKMQRRIEWEKIKLDDGAYESAGVFDVNNNGIPDIVCGGYWYEGPDYNGKPLEEAEKLIDQMLVQFPDKLQGERENLLRAKESIQVGEAERDWRMAQFYAKKRHYGGARYHYNLLVREHPRTRYAQLAMARLEETADKPAEPTNRLAWLSKLFTLDQIRR